MHSNPQGRYHLESCRLVPVLSLPDISTPTAAASAGTRASSPWAHAWGRGCSNSASSRRRLGVSAVPDGGGGEGHRPRAASSHERRAAARTVRRICWST